MGRDKCTKNGIDTSDLYYDFDLPGDAYPFGDAEGMDWVPDDWKPPKKGDPKFLPTRMLGQLTMRNQLYDVTIKAQEQGVDVSDVLIPFVDEDGNACDPKYDSNQKRYVEIRNDWGCKRCIPNLNLVVSLISLYSYIILSITSIGISSITNSSFFQKSKSLLHLRELGILLRLLGRFFRLLDRANLPDVHHLRSQFWYALKDFISSVTVTISTAPDFFFSNGIIVPLCCVAAATVALSASPACFEYGKRIKLDMYAFNLSTFVAKDSSDLFFACGRRKCQWSGRVFRDTAAFNSSSVKPLPSLCLKLYLCVGHLTAGLKAPETGRGKILCFLLACCLDLQNERKRDVSERKQAKSFPTSGENGEKAFFAEGKCDGRKCPEPPPRRLIRKEPCKRTNSTGLLATGLIKPCSHERLRAVPVIRE